MSNVSTAQPVVSAKTALVWNAASDISIGLIWAAAYRNQKIELGTQLKDARTAYWKDFATGPVREQVRKAYSEALIKKDFMNAGNYEASHSSNRDIRQLYGMAEGLTGGQIEGTIPFARLEFEAWVEKLLTELNRGAQPAAAFRTALAQYSIYAATRDQGESLFKNPDSPLLSGDGHSLGLALLSTCKIMPESFAASRMDELERTVSLPVITEAARAVSQVMRDVMNGENRKLGLFREFTMHWTPALTGNNPKEGWCFSPTQLEFELGQRDPRAYAIRLAKSDGKTSWTEAAKVVAGWEKQFGSDQFISATGRVRAAAGTTQSVTDRTLCKFDVPIFCLKELLGLPDPRLATAKSTSSGAVLATQKKQQLEAEEYKVQRTIMDLYALSRRIGPGGFNLEVGELLRCWTKYYDSREKNLQDLRQCAVLKRTLIATVEQRVPGSPLLLPLKNELKFMDQ